MTGLATAGALIFAGGSVQTSSDAVKVAREQLKQAQDNQITERFTKAVNQLSSREPTVRLSGIYTLERVAGDSARDQPVVTEALCAFIRVKTEQILSRKNGRLPDHPDLDTQAALSVIGRRTIQRQPEVVDLRKTHLVGADLMYAHLANANLEMVNLSFSQLKNASLTGAKLSNARFPSTDFTHAELGGATMPDISAAHAKFVDADLRGATLRNAKLSSADFKNAKLGQADLDSADLRGARNITLGQLRSAKRITAGTRLPEGFLWTAAKGVRKK
ncbi:pentapeptide repeat-containing protein [Streptosporangium sp. NPDC051023]|uniref:pentapeptide repeat-containing protein n=1 Tax=Streptosporangium sp. NPDC051023 TaxID=3155410 RepID=UPI003450D026